jgi:signal recognition particle subunit SRP54
MFETLQNGLSSAFKTLRGHAKLTESNMREGLQEVLQALLEADVSYSVAKDFIANVAEQATGEHVLKSLKPMEHLVGIVHKELVDLMGPVDHSLHLKPDLSIIMMCGLQGSGKTTTCGKLGKILKERQKRPMLVAADLQRPAAIQQLQVLGEQLGMPVYADLEEKDPVRLCQAAVRKAKGEDVDVVILDTAGRLHVDDELMGQLTRIDNRVQPNQVYLVVDGMTGQDAVNSAKVFNEALELDGVIMTKLDGDARGGAALSVKAVAQVPIKYIGTGEHMDALEEFHPERLAGRILGMGDMLSLVEQAQRKFDQEEMQKQEDRLKKGEFTLDDFKKILGQTKKLGPLNKVMGMIPGMGGMMEAMGDVDAEKDMQRLGGIIDSMTPEERRNPKQTIDQSRRRRIAEGAGVQPHEVNELVKQFEPMATMMKEISSMGPVARMRKMRELSSGKMLDAKGRLKSQKKSSGKRLSPKEKAKLKKERERQKRRERRQKNK